VQVLMISNSQATIAATQGGSWMIVSSTMTQLLISECLTYMRKRINSRDLMAQARTRMLGQELILLTVSMKKTAMVHTAVQSISLAIVEEKSTFATTLSSKDTIHIAWQKKIQMPFASIPMTIAAHALEDMGARNPRDLPRTGVS